MLALQRREDPYRKKEGVGILGMLGFFFGSNPVAVCWAWGWELEWRGT